MKKRLTAVSIIANVILLAGLLWMRAEHRSELLDVWRVAMQNDEQHLGLHALSLAALEHPDSEEAKATTDILRKFVAGGQENIEARRRAGL